MPYHIQPASQSSCNNLHRLTNSTFDRLLQWSTDDPAEQDRNESNSGPMMDGIRSILVERLAGNASAPRTG
eukprot:scaffold145927_cov20-Prasinocladus_malaysianus.AAC.1